MPSCCSRAAAPRPASWLGRPTVTSIWLGPCSLGRATFVRHSGWLGHEPWRLAWRSRARDHRPCSCAPLDRQEATRLARLRVPWPATRPLLKLAIGSGLTGSTYPKPMPD
jgi:hypothetical protein